MSNPDDGNVPAQPVDGEVKEIEEQQASPLCPQVVSLGHLQRLLPLHQQVK